MYKLTIDFKNIEDLSAFVQKNGSGVVQAHVEKVSTIINADSITTPAPKTKAAPKTKPVEVAQVFEAPAPEVMEEVKSPFKEVHQPSTVNGSFNREGAIQKASALVGELRKVGKVDADILQMINDVCLATGCQTGLKISALDDASLSKFLPKFEEYVGQVTKPQSGNFI
jgi:hypothetical protein